MATSTKTQRPTKRQKVALLRKMRKTLSRKAAWGKGANARNENGHSVDPTDDQAVQFCLQGAALNALGTREAIPLFTQTIMEIGRTIYDPKKSDRHESEMTDPDYLDEAIGFNDNQKTTHQALLGAIDRTVNRLTKTSK